MSFTESADYVAVLRTCARNKDLLRGSCIHSDLSKTGLLGKNPYADSALVHMYAKCGALVKAQLVLDEIPMRDEASWNALIGGYAQEGHGLNALACTKLMQREGLSPTAVTFSFILKACGSIRALEEGSEIHAEIVRMGLLHDNVVLGNALIDMYVVCGTLSKARQVLDQLRFQDVISWSTLIAGYAEHGHSEEALNCFAQMQQRNISPNKATFISILKACTDLRAANIGEKVHNELIRQKLLEKDIVLGTVLVGMYANCGVFAKAQELLDWLPLRDVYSWSSLIAAYTQHGPTAKVLECHERMCFEGLSPNAVTLTYILKACGMLGAGDNGEKLHEEIVKNRFLEKDVVLGTALVDMYAKCGALVKARKALYELPVWNVVSWSALITGYAQHGHAEEALDCFEQMQYEGISPNVVTFSGVLSACSHSGLVYEGQTFFSNMNKKHGITPDLDHHTCMVDLFGRAGHFDKAVALIKKMPSSDCFQLWVALMGACQVWGNLELRQFALEHAGQLDKKNAVA